MEQDASAAAAALAALAGVAPRGAQGAQHRAAPLSVGAAAQRQQVPDATAVSAARSAGAGALREHQALRGPAEGHGESSLAAWNAAQMVEEEEEEEEEEEAADRTHTVSRRRPCHGDATGVAGTSSSSSFQGGSGARQHNAPLLAAPPAAAHLAVCNHDEEEVEACLRCYSRAAQAARAAAHSGVGGTQAGAAAAALDALRHCLGARW